MRTRSRRNPRLLPSAFLLTLSTMLPPNHTCGFQLIFVMDSFSCFFSVPSFIFRVLQRSTLHKCLLRQMCSKPLRRSGRIFRRRAARLSFFSAVAGARADFSSPARSLRPAFPGPTCGPALPGQRCCLDRGKLERQRCRLHSEVAVEHGSKKTVFSADCHMNCRHPQRRSGTRRSSLSVCNAAA